MIRDVYYVVDARGWVQEARLAVLAAYLPEIHFHLVAAEDLNLPSVRRGVQAERLYVASWRILREYEGSLRWFDLFQAMTSVTSHYNIGGGLNPAMALPAGARGEEVFASAIRLLRLFKIVTANSRMLYELLAPHVPGLVYAPNGVDVNFFQPASRKPYDPRRLVIGWVGKVKAAKNYEEAIRPAFHRLARQGFEIREVPLKKDEGAQLDKGEMRAFYQELDYYLCASWHEGTPNPALEAAACGVPVVTTRVGNMPELIRHGENGFFIEPSEESIVETLLTLRHLPPGTYDRMRVQIRTDIESAWSWERAIGAYREAFLRLWT